MTWKRRSAPALSIGKKPSSSMIKSSGRVYFFSSCFIRPVALAAARVLMTSMAVANRTVLPFRQAA